MDRTKLIALALSCGALSGCLGAPASSSPTDTVTVTPSARGTPDPSLAGPLGLIVFDGCVGAYNTNDVDSSRARAKTPPGFHVSGFTPRTTGVMALLLMCKRISTPDAVFENSSLLVTAIWASPDNQSWYGKGLNWFVLDAVASHAGLVDALENRGLNSTRAEFKLDNMEGPSLVRRVAAVDGTGKGFRIEIPDFQESGRKYQNPYSFWTGSNPFHRVDFISDYLASKGDLVPGQFFSTGTSATKEVFGDALPMLQIPIQAGGGNIPASQASFVLGGTK